MATRFEMPGDELPQIDITKRYDVFCAEMGQRIVVYRSALFKGVKKLVSTQKIDIVGQFIELEQANGHTVFLSRHSIFKFCEPGVLSDPEIIVVK